MNETIHALANAPNFAVLTTLFPDGRPQSSVVWIGSDGEHLLVNTEVHRVKSKNIENDPRVTIVIIDNENPYRYAEAEGEVVEKVTGNEARAHIDELSRRYVGSDYSDDAISTERVILKIKPNREFVFG